ncbi:AI-2E family transporter [Blastococcus sp. PRF04-17]|uniref:AI-2E family transporter n=1 Tax=Blastococcus sp. PRF04-17 TaxID=2933797 RepID=UPI001FF6832D|nr:AI-2E family transporter [Blastococcus sp. PRF04-17]UOY02595.1 AI-2E family transporter [Blastococcus sp. PRF04-17]
MRTPRPAGRDDAVLLRTGRRAWAALGVAGVLVLLFLLLREVSIIATPLVVAMFPAAVLTPAASWLKRRGVPGAVAALLLVLAMFAVVGLALWFVIPQFVDQLPALADSVQEAFDDLEDLLAGSPLPLPLDIGEGGLSAAAQEALDSFDGGAGEVVGQGLDLLQRVVDLGTALVIFLVALFFYLRDGDRIWAGVTSLLPGTSRHQVRQVSGQLWWTLGAYFRAQMLVALVDAIAIGIGLALLGVPLALPLALLVFFGGFFPIVGAFVSGFVAVLVALADQGLGTALLVLGLVVLVQQAEGNLLEPLIISPVLRLHPFAIILAVTAGAVTFGVLGAFLAVPLAACAGRVIDYARGRRPAAGPGSDPDDDEPAWDDGTDAEADPPRAGSRDG